MESPISAEPPAVTIPIRPVNHFIEPDLTWVNQVRVAGLWITGVARKFPRGTGYCGLCQLTDCCSVEDSCLVMVVGYVHEDVAPRFSKVLGRPLLASDDLTLASQRS